jgi:hypothetical protein
MCTPRHRPHALVRLDTESGLEDAELAADANELRRNYGLYTSHPAGHV